MTLWMIGKNSMKHHYPKDKIFTVTYDTLLSADIFENFRNMWLKI